MKSVLEGRLPAKIWAENVEQAALDQIKNVQALPFIHKHVAVMADAHYGNGTTVGFVIPTIGAVIPAAVGVDISCGMGAIQTNLTSNDLPESLKALRDSLEAAIPVGFSAYADAGHLTASEHAAINIAGIRDLFDKHKITEGKAGILQQCGTLGGGNHFIELCLDEHDAVWIMLHSGSRGIGNKIGARFIELAKKDMERHFINLPDKELAYLSEGTEHFDEYVRAVEWAQNYATTNRRVMMRRIIETLKRSFPQLEVNGDTKAIYCHHNYISREHHFGKDCIVTRKGAVRADKGMLGIIPGSMGTRSYIVEGLGNPQSFNSCSHGAGRVMSRTEAKKRITLEEHAEATKGVECRKDKDMIDESPAAYKSIDAVMAAQTDLVKPLFTLKQFLCVKG